MSFKFATEASDSEYSYNLVSLECVATPEQATEVSKACTKCGEVKGLSGFSAHKRGKFGRASLCRPCDAAASKARSHNLALTANERVVPKEKHCSKCNMTKGASQFNVVRGNKDTLCAYCRQCSAAVNKARSNNLTVTAGARAAPQEKQCTNCKETKSAQHFHTARGNPDTLTSKCKTCSAAKDAAWLRANPAKANARTARRTASKLQRTAPWANKTAIGAVYATARIENLEVDHIIPLRGKKASGLHTETNLQLLTKPENISKGNRFNSEAYTHIIPQSTGAESLALWACLAPHRTQTND